MDSRLSRWIPFLLLALTLGLAGCQEQDEPSPPPPGQPKETAEKAAECNRSEDEVYVYYRDCFDRKEDCGEWNVDHRAEADIARECEEWCSEGECPHGKACELKNSVFNIERLTKASLSQCGYNVVPYLCVLSVQGTCWCKCPAEDE